MKKIFYGLGIGMSLLLFFVCEISPAKAADGDYTYNLLPGDNAEITGYSGVDNIITIPSTLDGYPVTSIGDNAFYGLGLTSVTIPAGITNIGNNTFGNCQDLTSIIVDADNAAYSSDAGVLFNKSKTSLVGYPAGKTGAYTIPDSVTSINNYAFSECTKLSGITIPNSVTSIGSSAFAYTGLTSAVIPSSVASMGDGVFTNCSSLSSISVDINNLAFSSDDGVLFNKIRTTLITYPKNKTGTSYAIPSGVTSISAQAFLGCTRLNSISISDSVTSIGNSAFQGCTGLTSVALGSGIANIGSYAFGGCEMLSSVTIPASVGSIGDGAFSDCIALSTAYFFGNASAIGADIFIGDAGVFTLWYISGKTGFSDPWNVYTTEMAGSQDALFVVIDKNSLLDSDIKGSNSNLSNIRTSLTNPLPSSGANGSTITWTSDTPSVVSDDGQTIVRPSAGNATVVLTATITKGASSDTKAFTLTVLAMGADFTYAVSGGVARITGYTGLGGNITIPSMLGGYSVTSISTNAFINRTTITGAIIPSSVTSIAASAFRGCTNLVNISIPDSVTSIGDYAFYGCSSLASITIGRGLASIGSNIIFGCSSLTEINVDSGNASYSSDAAGVMFNKDKTTIVLYPRGKVGSYVIPDGVIIVGDSAFGGAASLTGITIPDSVTTISFDAFYSTGLTSVIIPNSVTSIGGAAFQWCTGLTSVIIPNSVTSIGNSAFDGCTGLTSVTIGNSVTSIGSNAFNYCSGLTSITIPSSVTSIGQDAFYGCSGLTEIIVDADNSAYSSDAAGALFNKDKTTLISYPLGKSGAYSIPAGVTSLNVNAFLNCTRLSSVTIPSSVINIGVNTFRGCTSLASVTIPSSVASISSSAFSNGTSLVSAYFLGNAPTMGSSVFVGHGSGFNVYYINGKTGFTNPWNTEPTTAGVPDDILISADKSDLVDGLIKGSNPNISNITLALANPLPSSGANGSIITWVSSNPAVVANDGQVVNRPAYEYGNATVVMTATITKGSASDTKSFTLTITKSAAVYGAAAAVLSAVGNGASSVAISMNQSSHLGMITDQGMNLFVYINASASFNTSSIAGGAPESHTLSVTGLDLFNNVIQLTIQSAPQVIGLKLGQAAQLDLNGDKIKDIEIKFANIWVNRAELTIRSLLDIKEAKADAIATSTPSIPSPVSASGSSSQKAKYSFKRNLSLGVIGSDVKELQKYLNANGFIISKSGAGSLGKETNYFGLATRSALIRFQKAKKIAPAAGYFGPMTRRTVEGK